MTKIPQVFCYYGYGRQWRPNQTQIRTIPNTRASQASLSVAVKVGEEARGGIKSAATVYIGRHLVTDTPVTMTTTIQVTMTTPH